MHKVRNKERMIEKKELSKCFFFEKILHDKRCSQTMVTCPFCGRRPGECNCPQQREIMAKRPPSMCFECEKFIRAEDAGGDDDRVCTCEQAERRTIVVTMKERVTHIECDDKGRAIVATCENKKEEESSSEDEEEGSWEEEEESSSSFEELVDKPSRVTEDLVERVKEHMAQRRLAYAKAANEKPETPGDSGVAAGKFSLENDDDDDSSSSLGTMNDEDLYRGCKPNLPRPPVSSYELPEAYRGKSQILEDALNELFTPNESAIRSDACRVRNSLWIDEAGLIRFVQAEWLKIVRRMSEQAKENGTQLTAAMIKEARVKWEDDMLKESLERYHWEEDPGEKPEEDDPKSMRPYIRRTYTVTDPKTGKRKFVRCHYQGDKMLESSIVRSPIDNCHARGCKCCECNVEEEDDPPPPLFCGKHQAEFKGERCEMCTEDDGTSLPPLEEDDDSSSSSSSSSLELRLCEAHGGDFDAIVCEKCAQDVFDSVLHGNGEQLPACDKHGSYNKALAECPGCVIAASESRVRIPIDPVSGIINTKTGEPVIQCVEKETSTSGSDDDDEEDGDVRHAMEHFMADFPETGPPPKVLECSRCAEADRRVEERLAERLKKEKEEKEKKGFWRCRRHLEHAPGEKDLCMSCRKDAFYGYPLRQYEKDYILPSGNEFVTPEKLEEELCARIGGRILRPEPRVPCAVCDEAACEAYTLDPDTGVRTYMKEAHEPKEHECPRERKKGLVRRGVGFAVERPFLSLSERHEWLNANLELQKEMEEKSTNDVPSGPPVKWAKRVAFTVCHDIERPVRNSQGEIVYTWCETEHMEEDKPFVTWYLLNDLPPDVLQTMREDLQPQNTIEIVTVPGDPSVDWVKCSMWPPDVMAISGGYDDYVPVKLDDDEDDSSSSDHDERVKLDAARASMKQYAEEQLALYSKVAQEMEKYFDEVRRGVGRENAMTRELNPLQLAHMHDELKSFLKQKEEEEEDLGIGWSRGMLSPESLKKFARQQIVTKKLLDEYAKKYPHGVSFPETTEPGKLDDDVVSPPPKSTDDEMDRIRAVAKEMKNRKRDAAFNALRVKELEKYKAESEEEKKNSEPVSIVCADDTIVRTELITFPGDSGRDAILVIPRSVGKTGVMNWKRVFRGHGDPPPIPEKQKMAEEDAKPEPDSNNKRERDEEEEADERVKHASRYNGVYRGKIGPWKPIDLMCDKDIITARMQSLKDDDDEGPSELEEEEQEGVRVMSQARLIHHEQFMPSGRSLSVTYDRRDVPAEFVKDDDGVEETKRLQREHDMQQTLDALKGKGLEKFLEHNMPVYKEPATLVGILQHMMFERPDTFGVTENTLTVVRAIFDENSFDDAVHRCLMHLMANVDSLIHSSEILGQLCMMIYEHNDNKRQCKTSDTDINSIIGHAIAREDAHRRLTHAIRFVLTQAYLKGKRPN